LGISATIRNWRVIFGAGVHADQCCHSEVPLTIAVQWASHAPAVFGFYEGLRAALNVLWRCKSGDRSKTSNEIHCSEILNRIT
jgi:hypothetical protein